MIKEFVHPFKGFGRIPSSCLVRMYEDDGETMICFIDLGAGTSVTNASEQLASEIVNGYNLIPEDCRFFETYQQYNYDTFDEIEYEWKRTTGFKNNGMTPVDFVWEAKHPNWKPCEEENLKQFFIKMI